MITELNQSYIRQSVDETLAGGIEEITVTDRAPIISSSSSLQMLLCNRPAVSLGENAYDEQILYAFGSEMVT